MDAEQRGDVIADPSAISIVVFTQGILSGRSGQHPSNQCQARRGLFLGPDVVADGIALAGHSQVERTDVLQKPGEVLCTNRITGESAGALSKYFRGHGRRNEVLGAGSPFAS